MHKKVCTDNNANDPMIINLLIVNEYREQSITISVKNTLIGRYDVTATYNLARQNGLRSCVQ